MEKGLFDRRHLLKGAAATAAAAIVAPSIVRRTMAGATDLGASSTTPGECEPFSFFGDFASPPWPDAGSTWVGLPPKEYPAPNGGYWNVSRESVWLWNYDESNYPDTPMWPWFTSKQVVQFIDPGAALSLTLPCLTAGIHNLIFYTGGNGKGSATSSSNSVTVTLAGSTLNATATRQQYDPLVPTPVEFSVPTTLYNPVFEFTDSDSRGVPGCVLGLVLLDRNFEAGAPDPTSTTSTTAAPESAPASAAAAAVSTPPRFTG